jgi:hypothetical protein
MPHRFVISRAVSNQPRPDRRGTVRRSQACADCVNLSVVRAFAHPTTRTQFDFIEIRYTYSIAAAQLVPGSQMNTR